MNIIKALQDRAQLQSTRDRLAARKGAARRRQKGMTLLEIMIVITLIGVVMAVVVTNVIGAGDNAKISAAKTKMNSIKQNVNMYYTMFDEYPDNLQALVKPPAGRKPLMNSSGLKDPWGKRFVYSNRDGSIQLSSAGPDRKEGTADDIKLNDEE